MLYSFVFFFNDTQPTVIYTDCHPLSLPDARPTLLRPTRHTNGTLLPSHNGSRCRAGMRPRWRPVGVSCCYVDRNSGGERGVREIGKTHVRNTVTKAQIVFSLSVEKQKIQELTPR